MTSNEVTGDERGNNSGEGNYRKGRFVCLPANEISAWVISPTRSST